MHKGRRTDRPKLPPILQNYSDYIYSTYSEATAEGYIYWPLRLHEFLNEKGRSLEKMTFEDLQFYLNELTTRRKRKEIMQSTVKTVAKTLRTFAEWLMDQRIMDSSEFYKIDKYVEKIPGGDIGDDDKQALTKEEISTAYRKLHDLFLSFLLWVGLNFGLRRIEYCNLRIEHIELDHMEGDEPAPRIKIENSKGRRKKTRYIPMFAPQANKWRMWLEYVKSLNLPHDHVFFNPKNPSEIPNKDRVSSWFVKISKITGIHIPSHRPRYTYPTRMWEEDVPLDLIQKVMGHSKLETTIGYLKIHERTFRKKFMESGAKRLFG